MGKLVKQLELDALGPTFSRPSPSITLTLIFSPCLMCLFSKFLQDCLLAFTKQTIHELTNSDYLSQIIKNINPTQNLYPHSSLFLCHPHDVPVPQEAVTED